MVGLFEYKRRFLEHLEVDKGRSLKTRENYNRYLERFFAFVKIANVSHLTEEHIKKFSTHLSKQPGTKVGAHYEPMKQRTQNYHLIAVRAFLKFLGSQGVETLAPGRITLASVPDQTYDLLTSVERGRLLAAPDERTLKGKRDQAILQVLFSTGLRISELCELLLEDVNLAAQELSVRNKIGSTRVVFLSLSAKQSLQLYVTARKDHEKALFVRYGRKAHDGKDTKVHPKAVQRLVTFYATQVGISRRVTPHLLRHSFATDLLSSGADLQSVQALLGHVAIGSTKTYVRTTNKKLQAVHKKFHGQEV